VATDTLVTYKKDKAVITMSIEQYQRVCKYFNSFNDSMDEVGEMMDFRLSELRDMDSLRWTMRHNLGFVKINKDNYHSDYKIPDRSK
jgi:hypothetical protein|tara:strand:+ start:441 stop:701 length:261 start_codon:yes stop_codon:yes gene_type:complete